MMRNTFSAKHFNKLIIVAALGYFVDIYDLVLFGMERVASLQEILKDVYTNPEERNNLVQRLD